MFGFRASGLGIGGVLRFRLRVYQNFGVRVWCVGGCVGGWVGGRTGGRVGGGGGGGAALVVTTPKCLPDGLGFRAPRSSTSARFANTLANGTPDVIKPSGRVSI